MSPVRLSMGDLLSLGAKAYALTLRRLRSIVEYADPSDDSLRGFLTDLTKEKSDEARALGSFSAGIPSTERTLDDRAVDTLLRGSFPSTLLGFGEGALIRDNAFHFVELLEEEIARFLRRLSEFAPDGEVRRILSGLAEGEGQQLHFLRTIIL